MFLNPGYPAVKLQILATRHGGVCAFRNSWTYFCNGKSLAI